MKQHRDINAESPPATDPFARRLRGILIPFTTPFDGEGRFDAGALRSNVERWNRTGVSGYVALGSTGERVHLDGGEYVEVIEAARACVPSELLLIAGAGQQSTRATVEEVRAAARAGADAVLVITPHFYRAGMTQDALRAHFEAVADASPVPAVLYNIPQNTNVALAPETIARLAAHGNIAAVKDSSGDMVNFVETVWLAPEKFAVLTGHAGLLHASLASGAHGAILAAACVAPRLCVAIYEAAAGGDHALALALQRRLAPLARAVTTLYGIGGLKAALDLRGYAGGAVRAPLRMPDEAARREIARLLDEAKEGPLGEELFDEWAREEAAAG